MMPIEGDLEEIREKTEDNGEKREKERRGVREKSMDLQAPVLYQYPKDFSAKRNQTDLHDLQGLGRTGQ